jgi:hypothetical protein
MFPREPVNHHRHAVARIVREQLVAGRMRLAHRHRQPAFPGAVKFAEPRIAGGPEFVETGYPPQRGVSRTRTEENEARDGP